MSEAIEIESGHYVELNDETHFKSMTLSLKKIKREANEQIELSPDKID